MLLKCAGNQRAERGGKSEIIIIISNSVPVPLLPHEPATKPRMDPSHNYANVEDEKGSVHPLPIVEMMVNII